MSGSCVVAVGSGAAGTAGSVTTNRLPPPGPSVTRTCPPWAVTSSRTTARPIPLPAVPDAAAPPHEAVEDPLPLLGGDAGAGVGHRDRGQRRLGGHRRLHRAAPRGVAGGVGEEVGGHLPEPVGVAGDGHRVQVGAEATPWRSKR